MVFQDHKTAKAFVLNTIPHVKLQWNHVRIDPLSPNSGAIEANFHEYQVNAKGEKISVDGCFTGTAHYNGPIRKLRNAHWSAKCLINKVN